ncbi:unnamed protein product [Ostreobium quekettii]|uniref:Uncharacterized protein n=1 Tax=Ostreobium quekettii TaxID=121088 RepID=A0A8S1J1S3_9CHLO|nr:unnamed protein product [Ostreobium quekettii]
MSGKGLDGLPAGLGSDGCSAGNMLRFLESTLAELDAAAGCVDDEAHRQLDALRQKTSRLESGVMDTSQQPEAMQQFSEAEIAHELDKWGPYLSALLATVHSRRETGLERDALPCTMSRDFVALSFQTEAVELLGLKL